jgi:hypothetical protein
VSLEESPRLFTDPLSLAVASVAETSELKKWCWIGSGRLAQAATPDPVELLREMLRLIKQPGDGAAGLKPAEICLPSNAFGPIRRWSRISVHGACSSAARTNRPYSRGVVAMVARRLMLLLLVGALGCGGGIRGKPFDEVKQQLQSKTPKEVIALLGKPTGVMSVGGLNGIDELWTYIHAAKHPATGTKMSVQVAFRRGRVAEVNGM